ncbi:hypothetical protein [Streptomyces tendae]|uniref:hypothetical protein n=1 Tax=Streptomyces tendae TaxID=1932 RepID=UPI0037F6F02B
MAGMIRPNLVEAVTVLKDAGRHDLASAVEALNKPRGYLLLQRTEDMTPRQLSLTVPLPLKQELESTAREMDQVLDSLADDAYRKVLAGGWVPPRWQRSKRPGHKTAVFQVTVDKALHGQVQELLPRLTEEAGYRVTQSSIILAHMCDELGVDSGADAAMPLVLWEPLRDHFVAARDSGADLEAIVSERVRELLDGSWEMPSPSRVEKGARHGVRQVKLSGLFLKADVREALHELAPALSERFGVLVTPGTIVRVILTDRLGEPAE